MFSDEKKLNLVKTSCGGNDYVRCASDERLIHENINSTVKFGGGGIMFWGCFSSTGVGELHEINEIMTGQGYAEIMKGPCISSINKFKLNEPLLLEDNDRKHKSKVA